MKKRDADRQERLTRLLQSAGPESIPALAPDPDLPARIRAMDHRAAAPPARPVAAPRWAWLSFGTAAAVLALVAGGVLGYRAGTSLAGRDTAGVTDSEAGSAGTSDLLDAWSQNGFADELRGWSADDDEVTR